MGWHASFTRYDNEIRTCKNVKDLVHRALPFADSDPKDPVYLLGAPKVVEQEVTPTWNDAAAWRMIEPAALSGRAAGEIAIALAQARWPFFTTASDGSDPEAVAPRSPCAGGSASACWSLCRTR